MESKSVVSRAHRTLRRLKQYRDYVDKEKEDFPDYVHRISFEPDEMLVGIYENSPGQPEESIVVTNIGLYTFTNSQWVKIKYQQIERIDLPIGDKRQAEDLLIYWNETKTQLAVRGGEDGFRDVFEFLRFLERVSPHVSMQ